MHDSVLIPSESESDPYLFFHASATHVNPDAVFLRRLGAADGNNGASRSPSPASGADLPAAFSYREALVYVDDIARHLSKRYCLRPGDTFAIVADNSPEFLLVMLAGWLLGCTVSLVPHGVSSDILAGMLSLSKCVCCFCSQSVESIVKEVCSQDGLEWQCLAEVVRVALAAPTKRSDNELPRSSASFSSRLSDRAAALDEDHYFRKPALLMFTTTAVSVASIKGVPLTGYALLQSVRGVHALLHDRVRERPQQLLAVMPLNHILALCAEWMAICVATGGTYNFLPKIAPITTMEGAKDLLCLIKENGVTSFTSTPVVVSAWQQCRSADDDDCLSALDVILVGGAPIPPEVRDWADAQRLRMVNGFGSTEAAGAIMFSRAAADCPPGSSTETLLPIPTFEHVVETVPGFDERDVGELVIKSKGIPAAYIGRSDPALQGLDDQGKGVFRTGCVFKRTTSGFVGGDRIADYIIFKTGEKCNSLEVERVLRDKGGFGRACVIGNSQHGLSDFLLAVVENPDTSPSASGEARLDYIYGSLLHANRVLPPFARISPRQLIVLPPSKAIPLTRKGTVSTKEVWGAYRSLIDARAEQVLRVLGLSDDEPDRRLQGGDDPSLQRLDPEVMANVRRVVENMLLGPAKGEFSFGDEDSLTDLGMSSLDASRIATALRREVGLDITAAQVITRGSIAGIVRAEKPRVAQTIKAEVDPDSSAGFPQRPTSSDGAIAVIGMSCRLPDDVHTLDQFWQAIVQGGLSPASPAPPRRTAFAEYERQTGLELPPGRWLGVQGVEEMDAAFFGLSAAEGEAMRPSARLTLELAWQALESACVPPSTLKDTDTSIYVAAVDDEGFRKVTEGKGNDAHDLFWGPGQSNAMVSGRLAYFLDTHGPAMTVETSCSSSLTAIHLACQDLRAGTTQLALVGATTTHLDPSNFAFMSRAGLGSACGHSAAFSEEADGYLPSEGAFFCVLKRLNDAVSAQDPVLGIIEGTSIGSDGKSIGLMAPNAAAQIRLAQNVLKSARLRPEDIDAVEAHGTGTRLGDALEMEALKATFSQERKDPLFVSSVKSVVGHLEEAAGLAGIARAVASFENNLLPGQNIRRVRSDLRLQPCEMVVPLEHVPYERTARPRRIMLTSLGFSGTIGQLVLKEPPPPRRASSCVKLPVLTISAKTTTSLLNSVREWRDYIAGSLPGLSDLCYTSNIGREHFSHRIAIPVSCRRQMLQDLDGFASLLAGSSSVATRRAPIVFVFTGQSSAVAVLSQIPALLEQSYAFRQTWERCAKVVRRAIGLDLQALVDADDPTFEDGADVYEPDDTVVLQPLLVAFQLCLSAAWETWGVTPGVVVGHSLGEYSAAIVSRSLTLEQGLELVCYRGRAMQMASSRVSGGMISVAASAEEVLPLAEDSGAVIAAYNAADRQVVSGSEVALQKFAQLATLKRLSLRGLRSKQPFHVQELEEPLISGRFATFLTSLESSYAFKRPTIRWVSSLTGDVVDRTDAAHWMRQACQPVRFFQAICSSALPKEALALEIGPEPELTKLLLRTTSLSVVPSLQPANTSKDVTFALSTMYNRGADLDWAAFHRDTASVARKLHKTPTYPFDRQFLWPSPTFSPLRRRSQARHSAELPLIKSPPYPLRPTSEVFPPTPLSPDRQSLNSLEMAVLSALGRVLPVDANTKSIEPCTPFVELGLDSLGTTHLRRELNRLGMDVSTRAIYDCPDARALARYLSGSCSTPTGHILHREEMLDMLSRYAAPFTATTLRRDRPHEPCGTVPPHLLLTGATGFVGAFFLSQLLATTRTRVTAIVRNGGFERISGACKAWGLDDVLLLQKHQAGELQALSSTDLAAAHMGLSEADYASLGDVTGAVHIGWQVDFNRSLKHYEPSLGGLRNLAELCFHRERPIDLFFISSIASCIGSPQETVPEEPVQLDPAMAIYQGYGMSKLLAEHILSALCRSCSSSFSADVGCDPLHIVRLGQVCGDLERGRWRRGEWAPRVLTTMRALNGIVPYDLVATNWVPVDVAARSMVEIVGQQRSGNLFYHVANPHRTEWADICTAAAKAWGIKVRPTNFRDYVALLKQLSSSSIEYDATNLLPWFERQLENEDEQEIVGGAALLSVEETAACSQALQTCPVVDEGLMGKIASYLAL